MQRVSTLIEAACTKIADMFDSLVCMRRRLTASPITRARSLQARPFLSAARVGAPVYRAMPWGHFSCMETKVRRKTKRHHHKRTVGRRLTTTARVTSGPRLTWKAGASTLFAPRDLSQELNRALDAFAGPRWQELPMPGVFPPTLLHRPSYANQPLGRLCWLLYVVEKFCLLGEKIVGGNV